MDNENAVPPDVEKMIKSMKERIEKLNEKWKEEEDRPCGCVFQKHSGLRLKSCGTSHWRPARAKAA